MNEMNWKYVEPIENVNAISQYEEQTGLTLPEDLKTMMNKYNAGMPELSIFDTKDTKNRVFKCLLSFNISDSENIFDFTEILRNYDMNDLIPFAIDPFGNMICIKDGVVVYWNHESKKIEDVAEDIESFINTLRKTSNNKGE